MRWLEATYPIIFWATLAGKLIVVLSFNVQIGTYGNSNLYSLGAIPLIAPAIEKALDEIMSTYDGVFHITHNFLFDKTAITCNDVAAQAANLIAEFYYNVTRNTATDMVALISPGCGEEAAVAQLSYGWKIPVIFSTITMTSFRNRITYPNIISTGYGNPLPYTMFWINLVRLFKWTNICLVYDSSGLDIFKRAAFGTEKALKSSIKDLQFDIMGLNCSSDQSFKTLLLNFRAVSRVLGFVGHALCLRLLLVNAAKINMTDGSYVYFFGEVAKNTTQYGTLTWQNYDKDDEIAQKAFQSLFVFTPFEEGRERLDQELIIRSSKKYNYTYAPGEKPNVVVKAVFESFLMFAKVLNETVSKNSPTFGKFLWSTIDTADFVRTFFNRTFMFSTGSIYMDKAGERTEEVTLCQYDESSKHMIPVIKQDKATLTLIKLNDILWPSTWPVPNVPKCGFSGTEGPCSIKDWNKVLVGALCGGLGGILLVVTVVLIKLAKTEIDLRNTDWDLDIRFIKTVGKTAFACEDSLSQVSRAAVYNGRKIWLKKLQTKSVSHIGRQSSLLIFKICSLSHANLSSFVGILRNNGITWIANEFCSRDSLNKLSASENITLDTELRGSLIRDLLDGIQYIHKSPIKFHGTLRDKNCLIDQHFTARIAEAGHDRLLETVFGIKSNRRIMPAGELLWIAPELRGIKINGTPAADIYSVGLLSYLILSESGIEGYSLTPPVLLPAEDPQIGIATWHLLMECWSSSPDERPSAAELSKKYGKIAGSNSSSFLDKVLRRMNRYADVLEDAIVERTKQLLEERIKCDKLLLEILPGKIVDILRRGQPVDPEAFESVTISFSDIDGFPEFVLKSPPLIVVTFLNETHTLFDHVVSGFDVYKVETINDSYVVSSGLPVRNGNRHASEVCRMSLSATKRFSEQFSQQGIKLRTGIHSGPCVASIVGLKRPRYCLFGDTINTASRMETHGKESKIHLSSATAAFIQSVPEMQLISRGIMAIKGKGEMETFWLERNALSL